MPHKDKYFPKAKARVNSPRNSTAVSFLSVKWYVLTELYGCYHHKISQRKLFICMVKIEWCNAMCEIQGRAVVMVYFCFQGKLAEFQLIHCMAFIFGTSLLSTPPQWYMHGYPLRNALWFRAEVAAVQFFSSQVLFRISRFSILVVFANLSCMCALIFVIKQWVRQRRRDDESDGLFLYRSFVDSL